MIDSTFGLVHSLTAPPKLEDGKTCFQSPVGLVQKGMGLSFWASDDDDSM